MKNWDYDKLFAVGNIVGVKSKFSLVFTTAIESSSVSEVMKKGYGNEKLSCGIADIQWIIRLDENGEVAERVFDRERDMPKPKPMPELKTGMFVKALTNYTPVLGVVIGDRVIYDNSGETCYTGGWDSIDNVLNDILVVYSDETRCFNGCTSERIIWQKQ